MKNLTKISELHKSIWFNAYQEKLFTINSNSDHLIEFIFNYRQFRIPRKTTRITIKMIKPIAIGPTMANQPELLDWP